MSLGKCETNRADWHVSMEHALKVPLEISLATDGLVNYPGVYFKTGDGCHVLIRAFDLWQLKRAMAIYAMESEPVTVAISDTSQPNYLEKKAWLDSECWNVTYLVGRSMVAVNGQVEVSDNDCVYTKGDSTSHPEVCRLGRRRY